MNPDFDSIQLHAYLNRSIRAARAENAPFRLGKTRFGADLHAMLASEYWRRVITRVMAAQLKELHPIALTTTSAPGLIFASLCASVLDTDLYVSPAELPPDLAGVVVVLGIWSETAHWIIAAPPDVTLSGYVLVNLNPDHVGHGDVVVTAEWEIDALRRPFQKGS